PVGESDWSDLEEGLRDDPSNALFELDGLVARILEARGLPLREVDAQTETEPETVRAFADGAGFPSSSEPARTSTRATPRTRSTPTGSCTRHCSSAALRRRRGLDGNAHACGPKADELDGDVELALDELDIASGGLGQPVSRRRVVEWLPPAGKDLPDGSCVVEVALVRGKVRRLRAVAQDVRDAHGQ